MAYPDEPPRSLTDHPPSATPTVVTAAVASAALSAPPLPSLRDAALAGAGLVAAFMVALAGYLVVAVIGCSALSGAPRKNVAWVLSALYLALAAVFAVVAAVYTPGT